MKKLYARLTRAFYDPVGASPLLFCLVAACCCAAPVAALLLGGERHLRFLLYAALQGAAWGWIACLLAARRRWLRVALAAVFLLCGVAEVAHYMLVRHCIDADSVRLVLNTDATEARGFVRQFFDAGALLALGVALVAAGWAAWLTGRSSWRLPRLPLLMAVLPVVVCAGLGCIADMLSVLRCTTQEQLTVWQSQGSSNPDLCHGMRVPFTDPVAKAVCISRTICVERRNAREWSRLQRRAFADPAVARDTTAPGDSLHLVVVIGESFIRSHSSLYGYPLDVNPCLERERRDGALTVFADATSPANFTVLSIANILNLNSVSRGQKWWRHVSLPVLFRRAGWDVELFTNQYSSDSDTDLGLLFFDPLMRDSVYTRHNDATCRYDGDFLAAMADTFGLRHASAPHTLTLWHLRGQHFPPSAQIPAASRHPFTAADVPADKPWLTPERRAVVADYANATLYNDSVVGRIIDLYRDRPALLVYFSDHGEEMWDSAPFGNRNRQRPDDKAWMRRQHDVPLVVWMSRPLRRSRPDLVRRIGAAAGRPFSLDLIGHSLLRVGGVASPCYSPPLDVLDDSYRPVPRITAQGYRYD